MKTRLLVTVLMLITVAAFAQSERREGSSNTNGRTRSQSVEEKKKTNDKAVSTENNNRGTSSENQRVVRENNTRTSGSGNETRSRETYRTNEERNRVTTGTSNRGNESGTRTGSTGNEERSREVNRAGEDRNRETNTRNAGNNENYRSRTETNNNGRTVSTERYESNGGRQGGNNQDYRTNEGRRVSDEGNGNRGVGRNEGMTRTEAENPPRERSGRTVEGNSGSHMPVDHRVTERRYANSNHSRVETHHTVYVNEPRPVEYRRIHEPYRRPVYVDIYWTANLRNEYYNWYPEYRYWNRDIGSRIETVSAYDVYDYIGDVARVYGKVYDVDYSFENDEYYLYFGWYYPYQDFSAVVPGWVAREFSHKPRRFFLGRHISVTGLVTIYNDLPEILVRRPNQIDRYY